MAAKIALSELVRRIENNELSRKDYPKFFEIVAPAKGGGKTSVRLKKSALKPSAMTATEGKAVEALAHDAMQSILTSERGDGADSAKVLAEGDSWFDLPWLYSSTIVDQLNKNHFPVHEIAEPGDTIANMIGSGDYLREIKARNWRVFMFSGGGNDILGDLARQLHQRVSGDDDAANAPRYIKDSFRDTLDELTRLYGEMVEKIAAASPRTKILVHGYAYAIAQVEGHWLGNPFEEKGFSPVEHAPMCAAIVRAMVDAFNLRLQNLAAANKKRVIYMNLRRDVKKSEWWDELHPRPAAARRMAAKIADTIAPFLN